MAATFKFRDNLLELNIAGEIFKIDAASEQTVSALQTLETGSQEYAERAKSIAKSEDTAFISELRDFLADCISPYWALTALNGFSKTGLCPILTCWTLRGFSARRFRSILQQRHRRLTPS